MTRPPRRDHTGRARLQAVGGLVVLLVVALCAAVVLGRGTATRARPSDRPGSATTTETCRPGPDQPPPTIDLGVQASTETSLLPARTIDTLVGLAKGAGASVISTSTSWRYLQPTADTAVADFRWAGVDRVVDAARAAGLDVRLQLIGMPAWAVHDQSVPWSKTRPPLDDTERQRWSTFVAAVARHVEGRVAYLEVWNEPNGLDYWPSGPDPAQFADLLAATYAPVKAVAPDLAVVTGGLVGNDIGFVQRLYDAVDALALPQRPFDLVGVHPFSGDSPPDTVSASHTYERKPFGLFDEDFTGFEAVHAVVAQNTDDGDQPADLYLGAFGYDTSAAPDHAAVPDALRATYVTDALELVTCASYVRAFSWYYLHPTPFDPASWTLLDDQLQPNQTYLAFVAWRRATAALGAGSTPTPSARPSARPTRSPSGSTTSGGS